MKLLSIVIPSRSQPQQAAFLRRALESIEQQRALGSLLAEVVIGLDPDAPMPEVVSSQVPVRFAYAQRGSQAAALNAAASTIRGDYVGILEDDDAWHPDHLVVALQALESSDFCSGTQLEIDMAGEVIRINDFPTPSGWVMLRSTWESVGSFDEAYRYHLDSDWLGRLAGADMRRIHLIEATAPVSLQLARQIRPWLANVADCGGERVQFIRHGSPTPLILRQVHSDSGMRQIATDPEIAKISQAEMAALQQKYGRLPS